MTTKIKTPPKYDLVEMQVVRKSGPCKGKTVQIPGWWTGFGWDGRNLRPGDEILSWKMAPYMTQ
jgi:hypothetical protein